MSFRRIMLWVMLGSLGAAAVLAVMGILFFDPLMWRIIGTAITTAVAAALMLLAAMLSEREKSRWAGLLGMWLVIVEYLLGLAQIWDVHQLGRDFQLLLTIWTLMLCGAPAMLMLRLATERTTRLAGYVGAVLAAVVCVLVEASIWIAYSGNDERLLQTALMIALFGIAAVASLVGVGVDKRHWRFVGLAAAVVAAGMAVFAIWARIHQRSNMLTIIASLAVLVPLANLVMAVPVAAAQRWVRNGTIITAAISALCFDLGYVMGVGEHDLFYRIASAGAIVAGCGLLALGVLARLNRREDRRPVMQEVHQYALICPGCQKKQTLAVGEAQCPGCGLVIHMRFEEPRCATCGYILYMLKSDRCPECGTPVPKRSASESLARPPSHAAAEHTAPPQA